MTTILKICRLYLPFSFLEIKAIHKIDKKSI
jgi:hypothetical protein